MYILTTTDRRPTSHFEKFEWPYLHNGSSVVAVRGLTEFTYRV